MSNQKEECPFKPGDRVVYKPSEKGWAGEAMTRPSEKLVRGNAYIVKEVRKKPIRSSGGTDSPRGWALLDRICRS